MSGDSRPADRRISSGVAKSDSSDSEPSSGTIGPTLRPIRTGRPRDSRFAAYYEVVREVFPHVTTERGRFQKARALYAFDVLRRRAPELVPWFASGHRVKTKALAAMARFDEPSIVLVAQQIVVSDFSVGEAVAFCDRVHTHALETT